ncbi:MAG: hypothetical protein PHV06_07860 [bacterium]|nr:hypothetical protein [bacterium]
MKREKGLFIFFIGVIFILNIKMFSCSKDSPTEPEDQPPASFTIYSTDFEDETVGELPDGWILEYGTNISIADDDYDGKCLLLSGGSQGIYIPNTAREKDIAIYFDMNVKDNATIYYRGIKYSYYYASYNAFCGTGTYCGCVLLDFYTWYHCKFKIDWDTSRVQFTLGSTSIPIGTFSHTTGGGWKQDLSFENGTFLIDNIKIVSEQVDL